MVVEWVGKKAHKKAVWTDWMRVVRKAALLGELKAEL